MLYFSRKINLKTNENNIMSTNAPSSSKFIKNEESKLTIKVYFPRLFVIAIIILLTILDIFYGANLPISLTFFIAEEISMLPQALNSSKLNCNRIENEITCSLSGNTLFGNIEKVFNSKNHRKLIKVSRKDNIFRVTLYRNDLLILITETEKIPIYTSESLIEGQFSRLNKFLEDKAESKVFIQTQRSSQSQRKSDFLIEELSYTRLIFFSTSFYLLIFVVLVASKKYTFDKEINRITIKGILEEDLSIEIEFIKIKRVHLVRWRIGNLIQLEEIRLIDNDDSILLTIYLNEVTGSEIADSICSFLQLEPYQTIEIPP